MRRRQFLGLGVGAAAACFVGPRPTAAQSAPATGADGTPPPPDVPPAPPGVSPAASEAGYGGLPAIVRFGGHADPIGAFIAPLSAALV